MNTLFAVETIIKSKIILQQLLKKKTKIFNEILVDIFSLSNETSRTITRCNDLVLFTMEFDRACSTVKKPFLLIIRNFNLVVNMVQFVQSRRPLI